MSKQTYIVQFDDNKIGRRRDVPDLTVQIKDGENFGNTLADKVEAYAAKYLASKDIDVVVHYHGRGAVAAGYRQVAAFTWKGKD